jgi:hypothetical protein
VLTTDCCVNSKSRLVPQCRTSCSRASLVPLICLLNFDNYFLIIVFKWRDEDTIIKVHLYHSIGESNNVIKVGHEAAPIFTYTFSSHIYLSHIYFVSFWALKPKRPNIFLYQSRLHTLKLAMMQHQFLPQGFLPITHTFSPHIYLFYIYFFSFGTLHPKGPHIFFYQSQLGPGG